MIFFEPQRRDRATVSAKGELNLAPYSYFNAFSSSPPIVGFSSEGDKDSSTFAVETGEFVWSMATWELRDQMNATAASLARGESEFKHARLESAPSRLVRPPRVAASSSAAWPGSTSLSASCARAASIPPRCGRSPAAATTSTAWWSRFSRCRGRRS